MWVLLAAILAGLGWFLFGRWRKSVPVDQRLTAAYWRNSGIVLGAYLLSGAVCTLAALGVNRMLKLRN